MPVAVSHLELQAAVLPQQLTAAAGISAGAAGAESGEAAAAGGGAGETRPRRTARRRTAFSTCSHDRAAVVDERSAHRSQVGA